MNARPLPPRVVVAVAPPLQARIRDILRGWQLRFVETGAELTVALDEAP